MQFRLGVDQFTQFYIYISNIWLQRNSRSKTVLWPVSWLFFFQIVYWTHFNWKMHFGFGFMTHRTFCFRCWKAHTHTQINTHRNTNTTHPLEIPKLNIKSTFSHLTHQLPHCINHTIFLNSLLSFAEYSKKFASILVRRVKAYQCPLYWVFTLV